MEILYKEPDNNAAADNAIAEATVQLPPIGKALHVLLNVNQHVFDEAAKNDTSQSEHTPFKFDPLCLYIYEYE